MSMIKKSLTHKSLLLLITCIASISILAFGMRGPDLSRSHRPKPKPRAYIEEQFKKSQESVVKKSFDHIQAEPAQGCEPVVRTVFHTVYPPAFRGVAASPLFSVLSRGPPAPAV
ncbi:hypothetical protein KOM00_00570 [Geomonas sp. Red69]|uniref:Uncharacterized protein n=1 Tax=Geomonas diazotrophica TaxID=2843197 RepID=A0ABX8JM82_9BACT|nr:MULTISPECIES: hypothetical protein [Geomonas]MBU5635222.1 hypothetical protein [Geomonas diazotrophica]QWV97719.1 hypothetical protein KP005_20720 [Geomonas nitrogeniifigens]QXE86856.1 hypothetical protein KP003_00135 [Geomonas nitrogeniifigens]